jgi:hypothetical protein
MTFSRPIGACLCLCVVVSCRSSDTLEAKTVVRAKIAHDAPVGTANVPENGLENGSGQPEGATGPAPLQSRVLATFLPTSVPSKSGTLPCDQPKLAEIGPAPAISTEAETVCHPEHASEPAFRISLFDHVRHAAMLGPLEAIGSNRFDDGQIRVVPLHTEQARGLVRYLYQEKRGHIEMLIGDRYVAKVEAEPVSPEELTALEKLLPGQKLASYKAKPDELLVLVHRDPPGAKDHE